MYKIFSDLMKEKGLTAYKVSKETGVSQSVLSAWKNGTSVPRPVTLKILADYLDVSIEYLRGETVNRGENKKPIGQEADGLSKYDMLNEENRAAIDALIDRLLASQSGE